MSVMRLATLSPRGPLVKSNNRCSDFSEVRAVILQLAPWRKLISLKAEKGRRRPPSHAVQTPPSTEAEVIAVLADPECPRCRQPFQQDIERQLLDFGRYASCKSLRTRRDRSVGALGDASTVASRSQASLIACDGAARLI